MRLTTMIKDLYRFSLRRRKPIDTLVCRSMEILAIAVAYVATYSANPFQCRDDFVEVFRGAVNEYMGRFRDEKK